MLTKVKVLLNRQLAIDAYIGELLKKLSEPDSDRLALARRLAEVENKLKGTEVALEEVHYQFKGERAETAVLQLSLNDLMDGWEVEKKKVVKNTVAAYLKSEAFNDQATKYFISGFEILHRRVLRVRLDLDLSGFMADTELESTGPEAAEQAEGEVEKDDAKTWECNLLPFIFFLFLCLWTEGPLLFSLYFLTFNQ